MAEFLHRGKEKKEIVRDMFDDISGKYDFLNHFLSLGIDTYWRKKFIGMLPIRDNSIILDIATGTGDIGFEIRKKWNAQIIGLDYSFKMLECGVRKSEQSNTTGITFIRGDGEMLPIKNNSIDIITIAYGFRNLSNFSTALDEFFRVLKPNGVLGILEFSQPKSKLFSTIFNIYFHRILPFLGKLISGSNAYRYLPESVTEFATRDELLHLMDSTGFTHCKMKDLTFGTTSIFIGTKEHV